MSDETLPKRDLLDKRNRSQTVWLWVGASAIGGSAGAVLAVTLFPSAAFARNPTGQFGWNLIGFALSIGIPLAIAQGIALRHMLRSRKGSDSSLLVLWVPVTAVGVALMILPLWWWSAAELVKMPLLIAVPMLPGAICLGLAQWYLIYRVISGRPAWAYLTILGAVLGAVVGSILGLAASLLFQPIWLELTWTFFTAMGIGAAQAMELASGLEADRGRQKQQIMLPVILLVVVLALLVLLNVFVYLSRLVAFIGI